MCSMISNGDIVQNCDPCDVHSLDQLRLFRHADCDFLCETKGN